MSGLMLDTNVLIRFLRGDEPFSEKIESSESVVIHPIVYAEFLSGVDHATKQGVALRRQLEAFLDAPAVTQVNIGCVTAIYYSKIYRHVQKSGRMIPQNDIWIAASALEHSFELATHDAHFARIPMLRLLPEDAEVS